MNKWKTDDDGRTYNEETEMLERMIRRSDLYDYHSKYAVHKCTDIPRIDYVVAGNSFVAIMPSNINILRRLCDEVEIMAKKQGWTVGP